MSAFSYATITVNNRGCENKWWCIFRRNSLSYFSGNDYFIIYLFMFCWSWNFMNVGPKWQWVQSLEQHMFYRMSKPLLWIHSKTQEATIYKAEILYQEGNFFKKTEHLLIKCIEKKAQPMCTSIKHNAIKQQILKIKSAKKRGCNPCIQALNINNKYRK